MAIATVLLVASCSPASTRTPAVPPAPTEPANATSDSPNAASTRPAAAGGYLIATARLSELAVYEAPPGLGDGAANPPSLVLDNPTAVGAPLVLLVVERRDGWLRALLPLRPNGSSGWVREGDVTITTIPWHVEVDLARRTLTVYRDEEVWLTEPIGVGREPTPTPGGTYYLTELLQPPDPDGPYGPFAFGLSGFSEQLTSFAGGDGRLGIHGTDDPAALGTDVSHGCIRLANEAITQLARTLPLGTPVVILP